MKVVLFTSRLNREMKQTVIAQIFREIRRAAAEAPSMFFAPLIGAWRGIYAEYVRLERLQSRRRL